MRARLYIYLYIKVGSERKGPHLENNDHLFQGVNE